MKSINKKSNMAQTIEVCFGDSECGLIKYALGKKEVVHLDGELELGRIDAENFWKSRRKWIYSNYRFRMSRKVFKTEKANWNYVLKGVEKGNSIRVWYSKAAYSTCGFHWLVYMLQAIDCDIYAVERESNEDDCCVWGLDSPQSIRDAQARARLLSVKERDALAQKWLNLCKGGGQLRAIIDGEITNVNVDFHDEEIMSYVPEGEFCVMRLVRNVLGHSTHWLNDCFVISRIMALVDMGKLKVVSNPDGNYKNMVLASNKEPKQLISKE